jgi:tRNA pseudouridine32 synthase/23S rRNA pseudouridine746 synthase
VPLEILHEDPQLVALAKPPGRIVIPSRRGGEATLQEEAQERFGRLWVVHRLDRGTSGLLLFARTAASHRALSLAFERREVEKRYLAVVRGTMPEQARAEAPLAPARHGRMRPAEPGNPRGKAAATRFRLLEPLARAEATALVECIPESGRLHQIRVHLAWLGAPLCYDPDYGADLPIRDDEGREILARTPLHAWRLALRHPESGQPLSLEAPLPADLEALLAWARRPAPTG